MRLSAILPLTGFLRQFLACCLLLLWCAAGHAAPPAAGSFISNTAYATLVDAASGMSVRLNSNTVNTRVTTLEALTLTADQHLLLGTGTPFSASHTLTNTGNATSIYLAAASVVAGGGFVPLNLQVVHDANRNGIADSGEPVLDATGIQLASGDTAQLLVTGSVPPTASAGRSAQLLLVATSQAQGARAANTDTLTLTSGAAVQVTLSASVAAVTPSQPIDWTARAFNNGNAAATATAVTIDGAPATAWVLRVPLPANTSFVAARKASHVDARTLYHLAGTAVDSYVSKLPPGALVDAVAWSRPQFGAGETMQAQFSVKVHANAAGTVAATAFVDWADTGARLLATSNTVMLALPARAPTIAFYAAGSYTTTAIQRSPGQPLFVQADAAMCNADPGHADRVAVTVLSQLTGDLETFTAIETGPNTGLFRIEPEVPTANATVRTVAAGNGVLEVLRNDLVTATISACGGVTASASTTLLIDPSGVVYDSRSNQPLAGATVELIDVTGRGNGGRPGLAAEVLQADGASPAPASVVTGSDGVYMFPLVLPSTYRLRVTPPTGFVFPSALPEALQPAGRIIDTPGSYGGNFRLATRPVRFDVPLDTGGTGGLFVQKTASKGTAEVGDFVDYTVRLNNVMAVPLPKVEVIDTLPAGFSFVRGSARLNGVALADPQGSGGGQLRFAVGTVAPAVSPVLTYRVRIGAGSLGGSGINTAQAVGSGVTSNQSSVRVQVVGGVFSGEAYVIGKVFADCRRDRVQDPDDPGVPGVRIYLQDGTYAVTDEDGKYSFYGLTPRTHVAKIDPTTLPAGASLQVLDNRHAGDAASRFLDLSRGELHKADFALAGCEPSLRQQIEARRHALARPAEIVQAAGVLLSATAASRTDARTLPSSGSFGLPGALQGPGAGTLAGADLGAVGDVGGPQARTLQARPTPLVAPLPRPAQPAPAATTTAAPALPPGLAEPLEELLPQLSPEAAFIGLRDAQVLPATQTRVRVKGPLGASFELLVNGRTVPATQVGKKSSLEQSGVAAWEYIGVELRPGRNTLALKALDAFGNARGSAQVDVLAPGPLAAIRIALPASAVADGATALPVGIALVDAQGLPVAARTQVTLQAGVGQWQVSDADAHQDGVQVFVEHGEGRFLLLPPAQPGKLEVTASSGAIKAVAAGELAPHLRPLIAAGIVEGTLGLRSLSAASLQSPGAGDVFERQIQSAARSFADGKGTAAARAALFLKGKVLGSTLLTLAYDSDKPEDTTLLRDIQPNQFYPVYGDSSARGFEGQSTGKLFVLLQNGSNYALLGDYATQSDNPARHLTQYSRALHGVKGRWGNETLAVEAFASRTSATLLVQEFRANGTSGPFRLDLDGVANSEQVHIVTRSRDQPDLVLNDKPLAPFTDYAIAPYSGLLLLKDPVASVDAELNPVFVRVSYSVDRGGPQHAVQGVEARLQLTQQLTLGAVAVRDDDPTNRQQLTGVNALLRLGEKTVLTAEAARSSTDLQGDGRGQRVELRHEQAGLQAHAWGARTDPGFYNTGSPQSAGQEQYGAKLGYTLDDSNRLVGEALKTANATTGAQQTGAALRLEHSLGGNAVIEVGLRYASSNAQAALSTAPLPGSMTPVVVPPGTAASTEAVATTSARVKLTVPVPGVPEADVYGLVEYAVDGSDGREIGVGGNYALSPTTRLYLRHDFINSLNGPHTLDPAVSRYTTVAGVDTVLADSTQLFNEYRLGGNLDGRSAEAAVGLRRTFRLPNGLGLTASVQRIKSLAAASLGDESSAVTVGVDYTAAADWKASGQVQWQTSTTSRSWLFSGAVVNKLDAQWTLLNRALYHTQTGAGASGGQRELVSAQSGVAFRPVDSNVWNALGRIEYKADRDTTLGPGLARDDAALILSTHLNVQPTRDWVLRAQLAAKRGTDRANGLASTSRTHLFGGRSTWDLDANWDIGLQAYRLAGDGAAETAVGVEVGYLVMKNLWLSVGYNFKGFSATDLAGEAYTQRGAYLRLRFKFDETLLASDPAPAHPTRATTTPPTAGTP